MALLRFLPFGRQWIFLVLVIVMVGDSVADVRASHEAGVKIASVLWDSYSKEKVLQMNADYVFHDVDEFSHWLRGEFGR